MPCRALHAFLPWLCVACTGSGKDSARDDDPTTACDLEEVPYDGVDNDCDPGTPDDDLDEDGYDVAVDCADDDPTIHPDADETCDTVDQDCDKVADDDAVDAPDWYVDVDHDGYGGSGEAVRSCDELEGYAPNDEDCDDGDALVSPAALEACNAVDDNCDGAADDGLVCSNYGGHRIDKGGNYYYALYNDGGFGILGRGDWYGQADVFGNPEGVTWNEDQTVLYYADLDGNVFAQSEPFGDTSTTIGTFGFWQAGGIVVRDGRVYTGDFTTADIWEMDVATGDVLLYAERGTTACKPFFGNNAMAIDHDGTVYAASRCGIVAYSPGADAVQLNTSENLVDAVAMDADGELYGLDLGGHLLHVDKSTGDVLDVVLLDTAPSSTWTMAFDGDGNLVVNYWGDQRIFWTKDGSTLTRFDASTWYPGSSGNYQYVTF